MTDVQELIIDPDIWEFEDSYEDYEDVVDNTIVFFDDKDIERELGNLLVPNYRNYGNLVTQQFLTNKVNNYYNMMRQTTIATQDITATKQAMSLVQRALSHIRPVVRIQKVVCSEVGEKEKLGMLFDLENTVQTTNFALAREKELKNILKRLKPIENGRGLVFEKDMDGIYLWNNHANNIFENFRLLNDVSESIEVIGIACNIDSFGQTKPNNVINLQTYVDLVKNATIGTVFDIGTLVDRNSNMGRHQLTFRSGNQTHMIDLHDKELRYLPLMEGYETYYDKSFLFKQVPFLLLFASDIPVETQLAFALPTPHELLQLAAKHKLVADVLRGKQVLGKLGIIDDGMFHKNLLPPLKTVVENNNNDVVSFLKKSKPPKNNSTKITRTDAIVRFLAYKTFPYAKTYIDTNLARFHYLLSRSDQGLFEICIDISNQVKKLLKSKRAHIPKDVVENEIARIKQQLSDKTNASASQSKSLEPLFTNLVDTMRDTRYINDSGIQHAYVIMPDGTIRKLVKERAQDGRKFWAIGDDVLYMDGAKCKAGFIKVQREKVKDSENGDKLALYLNCYSQAENKALVQLYNYQQALENINHVNYIVENYTRASNALIDDLEYFSKLANTKEWNYTPKQYVFFDRDMAENDLEDDDNEQEFTDEGYTETMKVALEEDTSYRSRLLSRIDDNNTPLLRRLARVIDAMYIDISDQKLKQIHDYVALQLSDDIILQKQNRELFEKVRLLRAKAAKNESIRNQMQRIVEKYNEEITSKYQNRRKYKEDYALFMMLGFLVIHIQLNLPQIVINTSKLPGKDQAYTSGFPMDKEDPSGGGKLINYIAFILQNYQGQGGQAQQTDTFKLTRKYTDVSSEIVDAVKTIIGDNPHITIELNNTKLKIQAVAQELYDRLEKNVKAYCTWPSFRPSINRIEAGKHHNNNAVEFLIGLQQYAGKQRLMLIRADNQPYRINSCCLVNIRKPNECLQDYYDKPNVQKLVKQIEEADSIKRIDFEHVFMLKKKPLPKQDIYAPHATVHKFDTLESLYPEEVNSDISAYQHATDTWGNEFAIFVDKAIQVELLSANVKQQVLSLVEQVKKNDVGKFSQFVFDMSSSLVSTLTGLENLYDDKLENLQKWVDTMINIDLNLIKDHAYMNIEFMLQDFLGLLSRVVYNYTFQGKEVIGLDLKTINAHMADSYGLSVLSGLKGAQSRTVLFTDRIRVISTYYVPVARKLQDINKYAFIMCNVMIILSCISNVLDAVSMEPSYVRSFVKTVDYWSDTYIEKHSLNVVDIAAITEKYEKQREMRKQDAMKKLKLLNDETAALYRELKQRNMANIDELQKYMRTENDGGVEDIMPEVAINNDDNAYENPINNNETVLQVNDAFDMDDDNVWGESDD